MSHGGLMHCVYVFDERNEDNDTDRAPVAVHVQILPFWNSTLVEGAIFLILPPTVHSLLDTSDHYIVCTDVS